MSGIINSYSEYITENANLFESTDSLLSVITDDVTYESYKAKLLAGLEESSNTEASALMDRQRALLIEEASEMLGSAEAIAYAVASFPILVDVYSEPILGKLVSTYPSSTPTMSIPRLKWEVTTIQHDGNKVSFEFPDARRMARPGTVTLTMGKSDKNIFNAAFTTLPTDLENYRLNKRNFRVSKVNYKLTSDGNLEEASVIIPADARGNIHGSFIVGSGSAAETITIQGHINFETGAFKFSYDSDKIDSSVSVESVVINTRIFGVGNGRGVIKAKPKMTMIDVNCDIEDSAEIENIEEVIQDWKALFDIDLISQLKDYVKAQIALNKDLDIAELLEANEPKAKELGLYRVANLTTLDQKLTGLNSISEMFKVIVPVITMVIESMKAKTRMAPRYLACGINAGAIIKSIQDYAVKFDDKEGTMGGVISSGLSDFNKLEIVTSVAIPDNKAYFVTKFDQLANSTLVEVSYKPFYVIQETTNARKRTFFKSRNWIGIVRPEGIGVVEFEGFDGFFGTVLA